MDSGKSANVNGAVENGSRFGGGGNRSIGTPKISLPGRAALQRRRLRPKIENPEPRERGEHRRKPVLSKTFVIL
jgi:hypothetical protein